MGMIPVGVDVRESMILRRSLSRGSTAEIINRVLDVKFIEAKNRCMKRELGRGCGGGGGVIIIATYNQVENASGVHLSYLQILGGSPIFPGMELEPWTVRI